MLLKKQEKCKDHFKFFVKTLRLGLQSYTNCNDYIGLRISFLLFVGLVFIIIVNLRYNFNTFTSLEGSIAIIKSLKM